MGCKVYVKHLMSHEVHFKFNMCFFVGYTRETKGYYFYSWKESKVFVALEWCLFGKIVSQNELVGTGATWRNSRNTWKGFNP